MQNAKVILGTRHKVVHLLVTTISLTLIQVVKNSEKLQKCSSVIITYLL